MYPGQSPGTFRITKLETENVEIAELKKENAELRKKNTDFRMKFANFETEKAELKCRIVETLRMTEEERMRCNAENVKLRVTIEKLGKNNTKENAELRDRITKVEQKQTLNNNVTKVTNSFNNSSPNFNSLADQLLMEMDTSLSKELIPEGLPELAVNIPVMDQCDQTCLEDMKTDAFLNKVYKKKDDVKRQKLIFSGSSSHEAEISVTARHPKCSSLSLLDLAHLFVKASDIEYHTKKANEEEILCWINFGKEFIYQYNGIVKNSNGKIGEKKAKGIIYDEMLEHLATIHEKRSKEIGTQLPKISRSSLTRRTQRSMKLVRIFEKIGIDKIKYLSAYNSNFISELTNDHIQEIIDNSAKQDDFPTPEISARNLKTSEKILPEANSAKVNTDTSDDDVYFDKVNEVNKHNGDPNLINDDSDSNSNSEDEISDDSDDDGYNRYSGYGRYNEYGERDRSYYYRDERYERKSSLMISPIISPKKVADILIAHDSKLTNDLSIHDLKIANEINTHVSEINNTFTAEIGKNNAKELTAIIEKFNARNNSFSSEVNGFLASLNTITNKLGKAGKTLESHHNNFCGISSKFTSIKASIEILQNDLAQHYAVVRRADFDSSSSTGSSNLSVIPDIALDLRICFKQHFDQLMKARNVTFDEMCFMVVIDIRSLGGNIKISTVKNFYNGVSGSNVSTVNQIKAWPVAKINSHDAGYASEAQRILAMFITINATIQVLVSNMVRHNDESDESDQHSVVNHSEASSQSESSHASSYSGSSSSNSSFFENVETRFKQIFNSLRGSDSVDYMCETVAREIRQLTGKRLEGLL
ncbi:hypothetical protein C1645_824464 [Glomus cerebriforme]|uniref:Uncharacterized protein n=1 Tax=Glomus cerebriforme TaxID=658196 RepID=A0A397SXG1_9GLOM|nr:hypothetical protein C1645_824464 [Glomus cerebriforme]